MPNRFRVFQSLQRAHSALFRAADKALRDQADVTAAQTAILFVLSTRDGAPITTIAQALNMGNSSITGLVDRMAARGFVRRALSRDDKRVQQVFLEPSGRALLSSTAAITRNMNEALLAPFTPAEQETIARFLSFTSDKAATIIDEASRQASTEKETA